MRLRKLEAKDAPRMLEWMHDENVVHFMKTDFMHKTMEDCERFIAFAQEDSSNIHRAVIDDEDNYMGTVSLKDIENGSAEFAITMHRSAMGKGLAAAGMKKIISYGFRHVGLNVIYWCVSPENHRAVRFYDKNGCQRIMLSELCNKLNISRETLENRGGTVQKRQSTSFGILSQETSSRKEKNRTIKYCQRVRSLSGCLIHTDKEKRKWQRF